MPRLDRRTFLAATAAAPLTTSLLNGAVRRRIDLTAETSTGGGRDDGLPQNFHADVLLGKILTGWRQDGDAGPDLELVSLYVHQKPKSDLSAGWRKSMDFASPRRSTKQSLWGPTRCRSRA